MALFISDTLLSIGEYEKNVVPKIKLLMIKYGHEYPPHKTKFNKLHICGLKKTEVKSKGGVCFHLA